MSTNINTLFVGKVLLSFPKLDSTNSYALSLISKNKPSEGTVISAVAQSKGRGQIGNSWESEAGKNITISVVFYPSFVPVKEQFILNQAISLGVLDFLSPMVKGGLKLKWPNDIYINDKKVAGILIQNTLSGSKIQSCVVGIGVNVNQILFKSDAPNPTSLCIETGTEYDIPNLIARLCETLEKRYLQLRAHNFDVIKKDYLSYLYRFQEDALYRREDTKAVFSGKIVGLSPAGQLIIDTLEGEQVFSLKEIKFL